MHALHRRDPLGSSNAAGNHRRDGYVSPLRTRKRAIDHDEEGSMELKKREGYF